MVNHQLNMNQTINFRNPANGHTVKIRRGPGEKGHDTNFYVPL